MKAELCHAFCDELVVRKVPDGLAVSTAFKREDGDSVGFYIVPVGNGLFRLEDSGMTLPQLMESGVDFDAETRAKALGTLLSEYDVAYDQEEATLHTYPVKERSEEHTSELQSLMRISYAVFCWKKKKQKTI